MERQRNENIRMKLIESKTLVERLSKLFVTRAMSCISSNLRRMATAMLWLCGTNECRQTTSQCPTHKSWRKENQRQQTKEMVDRQSIT